MSFRGLSENLKKRKSYINSLVVESFHMVDALNVEARSVILYQKERYIVLGFLPLCVVVLVKESDYLDGVKPVLYVSLNQTKFKVVDKIDLGTYVLKLAFMKSFVKDLVKKEQLKEKIKDLFASMDESVTLVTDDAFMNVFLYDTTMAKQIGMLVGSGILAFFLAYKGYWFLCSFAIIVFLALSRYGIKRKIASRKYDKVKREEKSLLC